MRYAIVSMCIIVNHCVALGCGLLSVLQPQQLMKPPEATIQMRATTAGEGEGNDYVSLQAGATETVLAIEGPAVIHRIWSTSSFPNKTKLVMRKDGVKSVLWEGGELPPGQSGDDPLRAMEGKAYWSYVPMRLNSKAEFVATDLRSAEAKSHPKKTGPQSKKAEGNKLYLQVQYTSGITGCISSKQLQQVRKRLNVLEAHPLAGAEGLVAEKDRGEGKSQKLSVTTDRPASIDGNGKMYISTLIVHAAEASFQQLRNTRLKITPQDSQKPCVDVPVPYLVGAYWNLDDYSAPMTSIQNGTLVFRFPIPIGDGLRFQLDSFGEGVAVDMLEMTAVKSTASERPPYRFCAEYRAAITKRDRPVRLAEIHGNGVFVGCTFAAKAFHHRKLAFLEGNEQIYIDGGKTPDWEGTGAEDYFNCAWYFSGGPVTRPFHGLTCLIENPPPRMSAYRYLIPDRIAFNESFRFDLQHGSRNSVPGIMYESVSFWYQKPPCSIRAPKRAEPPERPSIPGPDEETDVPGVDMVTPIILTVFVVLFGVVAVRYILRRLRGER